jgi:hypothetical protein
MYIRSRKVHKTVEYQEDLQEKRCPTLYISRTACQRACGIVHERSYYRSKAVSITSRLILPHVAITG